MQTSGRAELAAAVGAIEFHNQHLPTEPLLIITDYYTLADRWPRLDRAVHHKSKIRSQLAKAPNRDLWFELSGQHSSSITIVWAPGHSKLHGNEAADRLAKAGTSLPLPRTPWQPDHWRLYHKSAEVHQDLLQFIHSKQPNPLTWSTSDINLKLSFGSLGQRGHVTRLTWLWGRTSWQGTKGFWERDNDLHCNACPQGSPPHHLDLFSSLAHCPSWHHLRHILFTWWDPYTALVRGWYTQASLPDQRDFCRSLIPNSLVSHLSHTLTQQTIQTIVRKRDARWAGGTAYVRQQYTSDMYPCSLPGVVPALLPLPLPVPHVAPMFQPLHAPHDTHNDLRPG